MFDKAVSLKANGRIGVGFGCTDSTENFSFDGASLRSCPPVSHQSVDPTRYRLRYSNLGFTSASSSSSVEPD